ncbi:MAG: IPT/TIG domain-containing protein, partial [Elusimicrobia bacterium]|nr:IPT/TIG domain-containing protein [Elusimicrobiota bacterium]
MKKSLSLLAACLMLGNGPLSEVLWALAGCTGDVYVSDSSGSNANDGCSSSAAKKTITAALATSTSKTNPTVFVAPGTYSGPGCAVGSTLETLPLSVPEGTSLVASGGVDETIIAANSVDSSIILFSTSKSAATVVQGFTISNTAYGYGIQMSPTAYGQFIGPTITKNKFTGNGRAGVYLTSAYASTVNPVISSNTFTSNCQYIAGETGVIYLLGSTNASTINPTVTNNEITNNSNNAVYLYSDIAGTVLGTFRKNMITRNKNKGVRIINNEGAMTPDFGVHASSNDGLNTIRNNEDTNLDGTGYDTESDDVLIQGSFVNMEGNWWVSDTGPTVGTSNSNNIYLSGGLSNVSSVGHRQTTQTFTASPAVGSQSGGTVVTFTSENAVFTDHLGADDKRATVTVGGTAATNVSVSDDGKSVTATMPAGVPGAAREVVVTNPTGYRAAMAAAYTYLSQPSVSSVSPNTGLPAGGTSVTVTGTDFYAGATVKFGDTAATDVKVVNSTTITCKTPAGTTGAVTVKVTNNDAQEAGLANAFAYAYPEVTVTGITPAKGSAAGGTSVTVTGTQFEAGATVKFGGTAATDVSVTNGTTLSCKTPAGTAGA